MKETKFNFPLLFIAFIVLHSVLILSVKFFPYVDLPNHLAEGTVFRYYNDETNQFNNYYTLHYFLYPNTFHLFFYSVPIFPSVEIANKVLHLFIVVSLPILVLLVINQIKGNRWFAIASFVLVYSYNLTYGFTGNAIALNFILLILLFWLMDLDNKKRFNYMIAISALLVVVYFFHAMVAMFCLLMCFVFLVWRYRTNVLQMLLNMAYLLPSTLLIVYWWKNIQGAAEKTAMYESEGLSIKTHLTAYYLNDYLSKFYERGRFLFADNFQLFDGAAGFIVAIILSSIFVIPFFVLIVKLFKNRIHLKSKIGKPDEKVAYTLLFLVVTAGCYFILPSSIPGQAPIYERFSTVLILAMILPGSLILSEKEKYFSMAALGLALIHFVLWAQYHYQFDKENKQFASCLPKGSEKVLTMVSYDSFYRGRPVYRHFQNYYIVWNKGISTTKIIDFRFGMIRRNNGAQLPYQTQVELGEDPSKNVSNTDYVLIRGEIPSKHQSYYDSFIQVNKKNKWNLYKKK